MDPWLEAAGGAGLFLLTFLSEDSAALAAALLAALGKLSWSMAFASCFLGIWVGDLGIYLLARHFGRPMLERFFKASEKLDQSEAWFGRYGWFALVLCRFIPGTRLPTFLAAGLLRMPAGRFAVLTGGMALAWVALLFAAVHFLGQSAGKVSGVPHGTAIAFVAATACALFLTRNRWLSHLRKILHSPGAQRWLQWEFWPAWLFYLPIGFHYLRLAFQYRSFSLPTCANPGMFTGGMIGESKYETLAALAEARPERVAESFLIEPGSLEERLGKLRAGMEAFDLEFPLVLKPDVAQRGSGFRVAKTMAQAEAYLAGVDVPVVGQRYVPGPYETGIFYYRFPGKKSGRIFAITEKIFPAVFGDGHRTVEELIYADSRAAIMAGTYLKRFARERHRVLPFGQSLRLVEAGNHAQGCIFRDGMHLWSERLEAGIDDISQSISGFHIGRYDVRFESLEEFQQGRGFSILELNGAASEATSAYDASKSLTEAYRILFEQWDLVFAIAGENRRRGHRADSLATIFSEWRRYRERSVCHPLAD